MELFYILKEEEEEEDSNSHKKVTEIEGGERWSRRRVHTEEGEYKVKDGGHKMEDTKWSI